MALCLDQSTDAPPSRLRQRARRSTGSFSRIDSSDLTPPPPSAKNQAQITEAEQRHRFKKDAPSGSALTLAENICKATGRDIDKSLTHGRSGESLREKGTIGMHAVRAGDIIGDHSVIFGTLGETVSVNHTANSRDTFVRGALRAAKWLVGKGPGLYSMADVLGI